MRSWLYDMECSLLTKLPAFSTQLALRHLPFIVRNARGRRRVWTSRLLGTLYRLLPLLLFPSFSFFSSFLHPLTISTSGIVMVDTTILWDALHSVSGMFVYRKRQNDSSVLILQLSEVKHSRRWLRNGVGQCTIDNLMLNQFSSLLPDKSRASTHTFL